jgi:hypothetical protein
MILIISKRAWLRTVHGSVHVDASTDEDVCANSLAGHPALKRTEATHAQRALVVAPRRNACSSNRD